MTTSGDEAYVPPLRLARGWRVGAMATRMRAAAASGACLDADVRSDVNVDMSLAAGDGVGLDANITSQNIINIDMLLADGSGGDGLSADATMSQTVSMDPADGSGGTALVPTLSIVIPQAHYSDDFNRANNNTSLGTNWTNRLNALALISNNAQAGTANANCATTYNNPMNTDDMSVTLTIGAIQGAGAAIWAVLGSDTAGTGAALYWDAATGLSIRSLSASFDASTGTVRGSSSTSFAANDTMTLRRVGNVYTAQKNGSNTGASWADAGIVPRDSSHRLVGCGGFRSTGGTNYYNINAWNADDI